MDSSTPTAKPGDIELWTIRGLLARHKRATLGVAAALALMLAMILVAVLGANAAAVITDASTCSQWGSVNQDRQAAYAGLYVREHGPLGGAETSPASIVAAINRGCMQAYGEGVSDNTTVVQAISGRF